MVHLRSLFFSKVYSEAEKKSLDSYRLGEVSSVIWSVTHKCNLKCRHCYADAGQPYQGELSTEEAMDVIEQLREVGEPLLFISGGEPLMRKDIFNILSESVRSGMRVILSTNGTLIDDEIADKIVEVGVHYVTIPVYGPAQFHDYYTGIEGSYKKALNALKLLKERKIKTGLKTVVTRNTYKYIKYLFDLANEVGATLVYMCDLIPTGRAGLIREERLDKDSWKHLMDEIIEKILLNNKYSNIEIDIGAHPSAAIYTMLKLRDMGYDVDQAIKKMEEKRESPVGQGFLSISPTGNILLTNFIPWLVIGNIRKIKLVDALSNPVYQKLGNPNNLRGLCRKCEYRFLCGGCRAKAVIDRGDIFEEDSSCLIH